MNFSHRHWENYLFQCSYATNKKLNELQPSPLGNDLFSWSYARNKKLNELQPLLSGSVADGQRHRNHDDFIDSLPLAKVCRVHMKVSYMILACLQKFR